MLGEEIMDGLTQRSVRGDGLLPGESGKPGTDINDGGDSKITDIPEAKIGGRFWDDEY